VSAEAPGFFSYLNSHVSRATKKPLQPFAKRKNYSAAAEQPWTDYDFFSDNTAQAFRNNSCGKSFIACTG
jgi:hypothetical protein